MPASHVCKNCGSDKTHTVTIQKKTKVSIHSYWFSDDDGNWYCLKCYSTLKNRGLIKKTRRIKPIGIQNGMFGKHHSPEFKAHLSQINKGASNRFFGKKHDDKTRARMSEIQRAIAQQDPFYSEKQRERGLRAKRRKGIEHPLWKGGITTEMVKIRRHPKYKEWTKLVMQRDNYTCQKCGQRGGYLEAHHPKPFAVIIKENGIRTLEQALNCQALWELDNGETVCYGCHVALKKETRAIILTA